MSPSASLQESLACLVQVLRRDVPNYVASGVVDLPTGMLLAVDTVEPHPRDVLDVLAEAAADLFRGRHVRQIERMWRHRRGSPEAVAPSDEVLIRSDLMVHLFIRHHTGDLVIAVVCRGSVNVGLLLSVSRQAVRDLSIA